ncbi:MAG TPA: endonuclease NucS [Candidatus Bathyarchaeia archaeon]|nr:endonuclease NucS [Candidatus Bathyarchaeia archaeon]
MPEPNKLTVLVNPKLAEAASIIEKALVQRKTLVVAGRCQVRYMGRARSTLEPGERILIIKEDGSLLVHRPVGYEPVNWQPPGSVFHVQTKEGTLEVHAVRQKPRESVRVTFTTVFMVSALSLVDAGEFQLHASEDDMHRAVLLKPSLLEEGFKPISYEKKVEPGFVDIYGVDKNGKLVVVEVKRKTAGKEAAFQLAKYIDSIKNKANREIRGILVAPSLGKDVQRLLATLGLEFKALDPKKCAEVLKKAETTKLEAFFKETSREADGFSPKA